MRTAAAQTLSGGVGWGGGGVGPETRGTDVADVDDGVVLSARHRAEVVQHAVGDLDHLALVDAGQHAVTGGEAGMEAGE